MKFLIILFFILSFNSVAQAACGSPAGQSGQTQWIAAANSVKWCNGQDWVNPVVAPQLSCSGTPAGTINYVSSDLQFCDGAFWQSMKGVSVGSCAGELPGTITWDTTRYLMKFCDGMNWNAMYTATAPEMNSLGINGGAGSTNSNNLKIDFSGLSPDMASNITHFCLKYTTTGVAPADPTASDSCWTPVNFPSPGIQPATNISFSDYYYSIGFTPGTYTVYGWVKNGVGYMSALVNGGTGSDHYDFRTIDFNPGSPPVLINVFATNSDSPAVPPSTTDLIISGGSDVYIKWKLTDELALPATPLSLYYTTDEVNFVLIANNIANTAGAGCSIDGVNSTGCFKWTAGSPTSSYYKIRIKATDSSDLNAFLSSEPINMGLFKFLAGTTDPGLGGSAASAVMFATPGGIGSASQTFVVRDNGMMFLCDDRGLMYVDPSDGNYKLFLPYTGVRTDGAISGASLKVKPFKIALDYQDRLLIYDHDFIRRVDFTTNQITTIIGGGAFTSSGTLASDFDLVSPGNNVSLLFTPLPNGDLWFQTGPDINVPNRSSGTKIRIYKASDNRIYTLVPTGVGSLEDGAFDPSGYPLYNMGISFNPISSAVTAIRSRAVIPTVGGHTPRSTNYHPVTGVATAPHIPFFGYWTDDATITSRNGEMYAVDRFGLNGIFKYNSGTNSWDRMLGAGPKGQCPDGTPALSCNVEVTDAYINTQNQIFFMDRNRIRTIDGSGNVLTLFGQSLAFGDGGFAASARVSDVYWMDRTDNGKIAFVDNKEFVMREFAPDGIINKIAGNGADQAANNVTPAATQGITPNYWGGMYPMVADPTNGTIYYTRDGGLISKLDRSTGVWVDVAGGGGTHYTAADGQPGNQIAMAGYPMGPFGFNGTQVLRHFHEWNGSTNVNAFIKSYNVSDGTQSALAGITGFVGGSIYDCADGTNLTTCAIQSNHSPLSKAHWDGANNRWLLHQIWSQRIRTATPGGNWGTLLDLPRGVSTFTHVMKAGVPYLYYCDGSRIYKYNLNTATETALFWPSSTINCYGYSMVWHPTRQSIIFSIKQNGLGAIAEIVDP